MSILKKLHGSFLVFVMFLATGSRAAVTSTSADDRSGDGAKVTGVAGESDNKDSGKSDTAKDDTAKGDAGDQGPGGGDGDMAGGGG